MKQITVKDLDYEDDGRVSYEGQLFTGLATDYWASGQLAAEVNYVDGLIDGEVKERHQNGVLKEVSFYRKGEMNEKTEMHENGQIKLKGEYESGIALWEKKWDSEGNLLSDYILTEENQQYKSLQIIRKIKAEQEIK